MEKVLRNTYVASEVFPVLLSISRMYALCRYQSANKNKVDASVITKRKDILLKQYYPYNFTKHINIIKDYTVYNNHKQNMAKFKNGVCKRYDKRIIDYFMCKLTPSFIT